MVAIHDTAPIVVRREIDIFAPPEMVWEWLTRVELWADWNPEITSAWWIDPPGLRGRFKWRKNLLGVESVVSEWKPPREFAWDGHAWLTDTRQIFRIDGDFRSTKLVSEQSVEGPTTQIARELLGRRTATWGEIWLGVLKAKLESHHERSASAANFGGRSGPRSAARSRRGMESRVARIIQRERFYNR